MLFDCALISDLCLFQEIALLNPCFRSYENLLLSFIDKVTTGTQSLVLFIWSVASEIDVAWIRGLGELAFGLLETPGVLYIWNIIQSCDHSKSSSISQFNKGISRDRQRLLRYFNGAAAAVSNVSLLFGLVAIIFILYLLLTCCCLSYNY